jgi:cytochrome c oxidase assembly protein subunit 15
VVSPSALIYWVWASLISQILIVFTGGLVRLTGSGLGCPTWPKCTDDSFVTVPKQGINGVIEFANRALTGVLVLIALGTFITVLRLASPERVGLLWPSIILGIGILLQAVVGGLSVLAKLTWWIVGVHFLISAVMIAVASTLFFNFYRPVRADFARIVSDLSLPVTALGAVAIVLGVFVTGAGPHAGDENTLRSGLNIDSLQHYHSYPAYLLLMLVLIQFSRLFPGERGKPFSQWRTVSKVTLGLLVNLLLQATVGIAQARLGVPAPLVASHMLLASTAVALLTWQRLAIKLK